MQVPVIDIAGLSSDDDTVRRAVAAEIGTACEQVGFLCVVGHGVDQHLIADAMAETRRVFDLPLDVKMHSVWDADRMNRGYDPIGCQQLDADAAADMKEAWSFGTVSFAAGHDPTVLDATLLGATDDADAHDADAHDADAHDADQWPPLDGFRHTIERYFDASREVCVTMMEAIATSLDLDRHHFAEFHCNPVCTLRLLHYPPRSADAPAHTFGAGAHTDWGGVTVLVQDDAGSLQVRAKDGTWLDVPAIPGAFVLNIGDLMERWTNGRYVSTLHRVLGVPGRDRYSIACFFDLDHDALIECLPTCCSPEHPAAYPPITAGSHLMEKYLASMPNGDASDSALLASR
jgi:isopenicillin N synthase-like dioxygenase